MNVETHTAKPEAFYPGNDFFMDGIPTDDQVENNDIPKIYFSSGDVAKEIGTTPQLLRHYINALNMRTGVAKGRHMRLFTSHQVAQLVTFGKLVTFGFSFKGAARHINNGKVLKLIL